MAVDIRQILILTLAAPVICLLLFVLTQVETWLLQNPGRAGGGQTGTGGGEDRQAQSLPAPADADDATAREEDAPGAAPPSGMSEAA
jgi:hypothetical protein